MTSTDSTYLRLSEVSYVQAGYLSRAQVQAATAGTHLLLQARCISSDDRLDLEEAIRFSPERNASLYRVSQGDILLTARGQDHRALLVQELPDNVLASSVFHIIRPNRDMVVPGYLAWWLNQPEARSHFAGVSGGAVFSYLSRQAVENLPVPCPVMNVQLSIAGVFSAIERLRLLQERLIDGREQLAQLVCRQAALQGKE